MNNLQNNFISLLSKITNLGSDRYVKEFVRVPLHLEPRRIELATDIENSTFQTLQQCANLFTHAANGQYPILKELSELVFIEVIDVDGLHLTVTIDSGQATIEVGWDISNRPTLIVPLFYANLVHLKEILSHDQISKQELYRIARVLFISFMRGLYDADYLYTPGDKRYLKLDNLFHVEMLEMNGVEVEGFPGPARATVLNVNGQWLVFQGWQGAPRIKVTCDLDQSLEYYYICNVLLKKAQDMKSVGKAFERYMTLREKTVTDLYNVAQ